MKRLLFLFILLSSAFATLTRAQGYTVAEEGAWCWFADPRALHYENQEGTINATWIGYIDVHGNIKATQHDFLTGTTNEVLIRSYFQPDDHDNPTFLILPDERVMIFYSRHTDEACFYYRISTRKGDITSLGEEKRLATAQNTTYPSPFILSNDPDHIYLCWRGIGWHPTIGRLTMPDANDNSRFDWGPKQIVQSTGARPYAKYMSNGVDKIYLTYTTGHPDNEYPNWLYFNYVNITGSDPTKITLTDVKGTVLSNVNNGVHNVNRSNYNQTYPDAVVDNQGDSRNWVWQVSADAQGNPVMAMVRISNDKNTHRYYHAKWNGEAWVKTFMANAGGKFHQTNGLELCYSGGMTIDGNNSDVFYCSVPVNGRYEIVKYSINADGSVSNEAITSGSAKGNSRPYFISNAGDSPLSLAWMNGDYYDWIVSSTRPQGYPTGIISNYNLYPSQETVPEKVETLSSPNFTVNMLVNIDHVAYAGEIFTIGNLSYNLDGTTLKPFVKHSSTIYNSVNLLGTSDVWQTQNRGTGGQWWTPTKLGYFMLTITNASGELTVYRNGLIDQRIQLSALLTGAFAVGDFVGKIADTQFYDAALSQNQVKTLFADFEDMLVMQEFNDISLPSEVVTDIVLPATTQSGRALTWTSSRTGVISNAGIFTAPRTNTTVRLTVKMGTNTRTFDVTALPRKISNNKIIAYFYNPEDRYTSGGVDYIRDHSPAHNDAQVSGNVVLDGTLNLTANTNAAFGTNGYIRVPDGILRNLRSYTVMLEVVPSRLDRLPRLWDFGGNQNNSVFGRADALTAGLKYNGGTTALINSSVPLTANTSTKVAFSFDAKTKTTKIYVNGVQTASSTAINYEPYQLSLITPDTRNYIGRSQWQNSDNVDYCGTIDNFFLYNTALTADEIIAIQDNPTSLSLTREDPTNTQYYDLSGRPVPNPRSKSTAQIYITGGKKVINP